MRCESATKHWISRVLPMRRQPSCQKIIMIACFASSAFQFGCLAPRRWKKEKKQRRTRTAQQRELSARRAPQREPRYPYFDRVQEFFRFSVIGCSAFCMRRVRTKPESRVASARSLDAGLLKSRRSGLLPALGNELLFCSCDGSVGLAAQEGRDIENVFFDQIAHRSGAAVRIEALRSRMARIFRTRVSRSPFGVAGRRTLQLRQRCTTFDPAGDATAVVAQPAGEFRE